MKNRRITLGFNLALFAFSTAMGVFQFLLSDRAQDIPPVGIVMTTAVDALRVIVVLLVTAFFIKEFWNRLVCDLSSLRSLAYQESIAMVLITSLLFS